jgi:hypothetical protein
MTLGDLPTIHDAGHAHTTYSLANMSSPISSTAATTNTQNFMAQHEAVGLGVGNIVFGQPIRFDVFEDQEARVLAAAMANKPPKPKPQKKEEPFMGRRLVQVYIADTDENVPLEHSLLYSGEQKLTDATDQELFFEIDIKAILEGHNAKRVNFVNKKVKERTENLEPVKIRDLKMIVVNVATF